MMLPSRGLARGPASALRYSAISRTKPTATASIRQFSLARSQSSVLSRHGLPRATISQYGQRAPSAAVVGIASSVFAQRSGAGRNLSLWPFGKSTTPTPQATEPVAEPPASLPAATEPLPTPSEVASEAAVPPPSVSPAANEADISGLSDEILRAFESPSIFDIPQRIGYLRELGLDFGRGPTSCCQWLVEHLQIYGDLPWWGTLAVVAVMFRALMFYPALLSSKHQAKMLKVQTSQAYIAANKKYMEGLQNTDKGSMVVARAEKKRLTKAAGVSSWLVYVNVVTVPFSFGMFRLLRNMAMIPVPGLESGGLAWFTDFTVYDPLYILPLVSASMTYFIFERTRYMNRANPLMTDLQRQASTLMSKVLPPLVFFTTMWLPAGIQWFLMMMSAGALTQAVVTANPTVRRWIQLPRIPHARIAGGAAHQVNYQSPTPAAGIMESIKKSMAVASQSMKNAAGATPERAQREQARKYEERRAEEDRQNMARRMEDLRRRRAGKRS